jgi:hypothetical protein
MRSCSWFVLCHDNEQEFKAIITHMWQGDAGPARNVAGDMVVDVMLEPTCTHTGPFEILGESLAPTRKHIKFPIGQLAVLAMQ